MKYDTILLSERLRKKVLQAASFVSKDRTHLMGVYFDKSGTIVGSNGHILYASPTFISLLVDFTLPITQEVKKTLKTSIRDILVIIKEADNQKIIRFGGTYISYGIQADYPQWERVVDHFYKPTTPKTNSTFDIPSWKVVYKALKAYTGKHKSPWAKFAVDHSKGLVHVTTIGDDPIGSFKWSFDSESNSPKNFILDYRFLNKAISPQGLTNCIVQPDPLKPMLFEFEDGSQTVLAMARASEGKYHD